MKNIYLDIDGVLLANEKHAAEGADEFITALLQKYPESTYWLTTHCQGDANEPLEHIVHLFKPETVELMRKIKPTAWSEAKTEAIDFTQDFLWFDDDLYDDERDELLAHSALEKWVAVDLAANQKHLHDLVNLL